MSCLSIGFLFFKIDLGFLKGVQNSIALHAQIYLITNGLGGPQGMSFWKKKILKSEHCNKIKIAEK
jgi:hypothetical protein